MDPQQQDSSYFERLAAMKLLRENMYFDKPNTYTMTDIAHELPGPAKAVAPIFENILPSAAIISGDQDTRKKQIDDAIARIKSTKESKKGLAKQIVNNMVNMGIKSIPIGFGLGAAFHLAGFRNPFKGGLRSPITPISNVKKLFTNKAYAKEIGSLSLTDALYGAGMGAASGAIYPVLSHNMHVSDKALDEARKIMEEDPYVTSLPAGEMLSVIKQKKDEAPNDVRRTIKNVGLGTAIGALTGLAGGLTPTATRLGFGAVKNVFNRATNRPLQKLLTPAIHDSLKTDAISSSALGGLMGGVSGMFAKNLIEDENQNLRNNQT
jgi:hypothetical protein